MATDQKTSTIDTEPIGIRPVIENEIPTYRAISARAIFERGVWRVVGVQLRSSVLLRFRDPGGRTGHLGPLAIRRFPDMLTGQGLANAGIALGLIFGWRRGRSRTVQYIVRSKQATLFAKQVRRGPRTGRHG